MDKIDKEILRILQLDARLSNSDLAEKVNLSPTPCLRRVKRLEKSGVIRRYRAELDAKSIGLDISAIVFVQLQLNSTKNAQVFEQAIQHLGNVQECLVLTGKHDYLIRVVARDLADYERFIKGELANIANIKTIDSTIVLNQVKLEVALPIAMN
jgi:DNA-binding Lrp family transcriptional regulator